MNLDDRARAATTGLVTATRDSVSVPDALDRLHGRRMSLPRASVAAVTVLALVASAVGVLRWTAVQLPASNPAVVAPSPTTHVALGAPFSVVLPAGWTHRLSGDAQAVLEDRGTTYVTVVMDPSPAAGSTGESRSAEALARWIAARPELVSRPPVRTTVGGEQAWQVDLVFGPDARPNAVCDGPIHDCLPLIRVPGLAMPVGLANSTAGRAIVIQLGDGRLIAMVAGGDSVQHVEEVVALVNPVIDTISFDHP